MRRNHILNCVLGGIFATCLAGVAYGMNYLRTAALETYGNEQGQAEWDRWREDVAKDARAFADVESGKRKAGVEDLPPVKRRVSKSPEPPALVMMRDRFLVCLIAALLLSGAMMGSVLLLIRGALLTREVEDSPPKETEDSGS